MRELKSNDLNEITIFDKQTGTKIKFFYRTPTTSERVGYKSACMNAALKNRLKATEAIAETQLEWVEKIITGFRDGDFAVDGAPISTDPGKENYYSDWKKLLKETAADLLFAVVDVVFDAPAYHLKDDPVFFQ